MMGKPWENGDLYGKSQFLMGKSTISMAMFSSLLFEHVHLFTQCFSENHKKIFNTWILMSKKKLYNVLLASTLNHW